MSKDDFAKIIDALKEKLDETTNALVSEELLKVNGKLYQKIGFDKEDEPDPEPTEEKEDEEIKIEDVIDEKGDLI